MTAAVPRRLVHIARLRPEMRDEYLRLHREVWPEVEATILACGLRDYSIHILGDVIVSCAEYVGDDYETDQAHMARDSATQRWWALTAPCQLPFDDAIPGENWQPLTEVWRLTEPPA